MYNLFQETERLLCLDQAIFLFRKGGDGEC